MANRLLNNVPISVLFLRDGGDYLLYCLVPEYDGLEIRRANSLEGVARRRPRCRRRKPENDPMNQLIWAPEILHQRQVVHPICHTHTQALDKLGMFQHHVCHGVRHCRPTHRQVDGEKVKLKRRLIPSPSMPPHIIRESSGICGLRLLGYCR